ncbi:MAG: hypothetical protein ABIT71_27105 [Vicinamibacteraceae bacterium]
MDRNPVRGSVLAWMLVAACAVAVPAWTQSRSLPDAPGTWKAWKPFAAIASARQEQAATPVLVKAFEAELLTLNGVLRRAPAVASPVGFSVETWGNLAGYRVSEHAPGQPAGGRQPLGGALTFGAFPIFEYERAGKTIREDHGETALQQFFVNQIGRGLIDRGNVPDWGAVDHDAFLQPLPQGEIAGLPRFGDGLVIARDPAALWTPLSQRAALDLVLAARQVDVAAAQESVDASAARLVVVRDPAWRAKRLKEAQQGASTMPDPQGFMKQIEESIRVEEASLVKELAPATGSGKRLADARRAADDVTAWVAELSPADLAAGSCYAAKGTTLRTRFPTGKPASCHPLVRPNYGYFNTALPRSAPQVVIIAPVGRCFDTADTRNREANSPSPAGCRANRALVDSLDKDAIRAWLR